MSIKTFGSIFAFSPFSLTMVLKRSIKGSSMEVPVFDIRVNLSDIVM